MDAGRLDRRITIETFTATQDEFNNDVEAWSALTTVWASKEDVSDGERLRAQQVGGEMTTRFRILHSSVVADVDPTHRIQFNGRTYDIKAVKEIGRREGLEITAAARSERD